VTLWLCVAPLRLGGLRGKKSTPSVWLGGTGEFIAGRQAGAGAGAAGAPESSLRCKQIRPRYVPELMNASRVECRIVGTL
jgi:hypothetical protein